MIRASRTFELEPDNLFAQKFCASSEEELDTLISRFLTEDLRPLYPNAKLQDTIQHTIIYMNTLNEIADAVHANAIAHGFHPEGQPLETWFSDMCNNLTGEVSELWEAARHGSLNLPCDKDIPLTCAEEELADIIIRTLDMSRRLGVNISEAVKVKHGYNLGSPHLHGKLN